MVCCDDKKNVCYVRFITWKIQPNPTKPTPPTPTPQKKQMRALSVWVL